MGSLLGRDKDGLLERPLGPYSLLVEGSQRSHPTGGKFLLNLCIRG